MQVECGAMIFMDIDCLDYEQITTTYGESCTKVKAVQKKSTGGTHTNYEMPTKLGNKLF